MKKPNRMASVKTLTTLALEGEDGMFWYVDAEKYVRGLAGTLGVDPVRFAGLMAAFSPRVHVKRNINFTMTYLESGEYRRDVMASVKAAVEHFEESGELRGPKTAPFARALMGDPNAIVLDTWMAVAFNVDQDNGFRRKLTHARCCERIITVAKNLDWLPTEVQAAIWTAIVRRAGKTPGQIGE